LNSWECHERVETHEFEFREYVKGEIFGLEAIHETRDTRYSHIVCAEEGEVFKISQRDFIKITNNETIKKFKENKF